jgi:glycosyltransferase involved in cell wall biosynthesis
VVGGLPETFRRQLRHPDAFEFLPYLSAQELEARMRSTWALLYPSLNEGFGYPPLDALRVGTPVLASRLPPLVEVGGEAVLTFDPYSQTEMIQALKDLEANWEGFSQKGPPREAQMRVQQQSDLNKLCDLILS